MPDRRTVLLDAALELVGTQGMRGLTHRAVDAAAGLPAGSTSNYFRT
ncbi:MAG TPA: TetR family transcriptional regulator, partial [Nocardioides sp.]|nr:TetR family transcriptional regulator [Nocardioides sp.]